jgi:pimeloyl-ACP methyl ester carboxylesterase
MRFILTVLILLLIAALASIFASLNWSRKHTAETERLPAYPDTADGLTRIAANGWTFRARVAGLDNNGPGLLLLHGFPETSAMWIPLIDAAAAAGFRVVAFDQRGYSPGARPEGKDQYQMPLLEGDALAIADAVGFDRFHLVAHDWGAAVGWAMVMNAPQRVTSWTSLSIPHIAAFGQALTEDPEQRRKSSYMLFFRTPWVSEAAFMIGNQALLKRLYVDMTPAQQTEYLETFSEPGAMTAALNWYRAAGPVNPAAAASNNAASALEVTTPTLFIWGNQDPAVGATTVALQRQYLTGPFEEVELDAGHWLMETDHEVVVEKILEHIGRHR